MSSEAKGCVVLVVVAVLMFAFGFVVGAYPKIAINHCEAQGYSEFRVLDSGKIECIKVTREVQP
jgi:hypothetical protein